MGYGRDLSLPSRTESSVLDAIERGAPLPQGLGAGKLGKLLSVGWIVRSGEGFRLTASGQTALRKAQQQMLPYSEERRPSQKKPVVADKAIGSHPELPQQPMASVERVRWTNEEKRKVRELAMSGKGPEEIAIELGRTVGAVRHRLYQLSIPVKRQGDG